MKTCPSHADEVQNAVVDYAAPHRVVATATTPGPAADRPSTSGGLVRRRMLLRFLMVVIVVAGSACSSKPSSEAEPAGGSKGAAEPLVTRAKFDRLQAGMSIERVTMIIGGSGALVDGSMVDDLRTDVYSWGTVDGPRITVRFENDKLVEKSQSRLK